MLYTKASTKHNYKALIQKHFRTNPTTSIGENMAEFKVINQTVQFTTQGDIDFIDLTEKVQQAVAASEIKNGIVHVFVPHATGILILTENDTALLSDIKAFLEKMAPKHSAYNHPANAYSHLRSMMLPPDKTLPIVDGLVEFGTWQSLLFVETDIYPRKRTLIIQILGVL
jgi:secondary thiamine-phosphate synthase enzyme